MIYPYLLIFTMWASSLVSLIIFNACFVQYTAPIKFVPIICSSSTISASKNIRKTIIIEVLFSITVTEFFNKAHPQSTSSLSYQRYWRGRVTPGTFVEFDERRQRRLCPSTRRILWRRIYQVPLLSSCLSVYTRVWWNLLKIFCNNSL